ncbi:MAG: ISL3 family transposase [Opitutaceae bacterium]|nr:ISL3 family transposase [Opitutaceae bacterium]
MQFQTIIRARVPRSRCAEHGVLTVRAPWAEPHSRFTLLFGAFAVQVIEACRSLTQTAELLKLDWDGVMLIMARAVKRGLERPQHRGGHPHRPRREELWPRPGLRLLMTDLKNRRVLEIVPGRSTTDAIALLETLPADQRQASWPAAMDMERQLRRRHQEGLPAGGHRLHDRFPSPCTSTRPSTKGAATGEHRRLLEEATRT